MRRTLLGATAAALVTLTACDPAPEPSVIGGVIRWADDGSPVVEAQVRVTPLTYTSITGRPVPADTARTLPVDEFGRFRTAYGSDEKIDYFTVEVDVVVAPDSTVPYSGTQLDCPRCDELPLGYYDLTLSLPR